MTSDELSRDWQWGGCGDNTEYGYKFTQGFVDIKEREKNYPRYSNGLARMLMNIHNNEAGRLVSYFFDNFSTIHSHILLVTYYVFDT